MPLPSDVSPCHCLCPWQGRPGPWHSSPCWIVLVHSWSLTVKSLTVSMQFLFSMRTSNQHNIDTLARIQRFPFPSYGFSRSVIKSSFTYLSGLPSGVSKCQISQIGIFQRRASVKMLFWQFYIFLTLFSKLGIKIIILSGNQTWH